MNSCYIRWCEKQFHLLNTSGPRCFSLFAYVLILEREKKEKRDGESVYAVIGCLLYVSWQGIEPKILLNQNNILIIWAKGSR